MGTTEWQLSLPEGARATAGHSPHHSRLLPGTSEDSRFHLSSHVCHCCESWNLPLCAQLCRTGHTQRQAVCYLRRAALLLYVLLPGPLQRLPSPRAPVLRSHTQPLSSPKPLCLGRSWHPPWRKNLQPLSLFPLLKSL